MGLFRQIFKPLYRYCRDAEYRAYLRVQKVCRGKDHQPVQIFINGFVIEGNDGPSFLHQYEEIIHRRSFDFKPENAEPVIYCCGANIGLDVLHLLHLYPNAKIKAFEPDPVLFNLLKSNIETNSLKAEVINAAVHTENGEISFAADHRLGGKAGTGTEKVRAVRLRDFLAAEDHIDLLVMDIEGAENTVLPDCADQLHKINQLFIEWHSDERKPQQLPVILQLLESKGFRYRLNNILGEAPFQNAIVENGFDAMVDIYASKTRR